MGEQEEGKARGLVRAATAATVGLEMGVCVALGWGIGYWLDRRLGTSPWLMLVFLLFGVAAGFKALFSWAKKAKQAQKD